MAEFLSSPESREGKLKYDLDRLFSPGVAKVLEQSERTIFLARDITRQFSIDMPQAVVEAACEGFKIQRGYLTVSFGRLQTATRLLGKEKITSDSVHLNVTDYEYSGGPGSDLLYANNADMTQPKVEYDERLANVVRACLEQTPHSQQE